MRISSATIGMYRLSWMRWKRTWGKGSIILPCLSSGTDNFRKDTHMSEERRPTALDLFSIREYRNFIIARFFYIMALRMVTTIVGWRIYEITHNPLAIGLIGLSEFLPAFILALY